MGFFSNLFRGRDAPSNSTAGSGYGFFMGSTASGKRVNARSAMQMTAVYSCVRILSEAVAMQQPPSDKGRRLKIFYMTQVAVAPPTFVIFVNDKELMHFSYTRYIENKIREAFGFRGTALKFIIRERNEKE